MFTMTGRPKIYIYIYICREREREKGPGHSKFHLSDLLMIAVYFGNATPYSLTRHFDRRQALDQRIQ